uniref:E2F/DP family winged-helix DNA-binding domain-containing protein n=3 Tax=Rhodosorus marinus TaxID=101924 RepID=A0A7S3E799_9RHOD|mmetsp:Transcript_13695/g.54820  ORF Transcript_13695/g.54820 Transcript_13695/m.54820 type:complete len:574 (+) Transcript_13695:280-2001(+)|eukprot:CAMPEP_0113954648 /NCGR_PEP_ID=MMETSP0011_2-20120614/722_1 /TAXON_ID=101924 /ORGANISM="Rhodosorus marinus" /LENGTH=573 /DNA_ID=CAMNT_0000963905 /DNA_START=71 /DNA_END=1792 /DNA_ORIENTATION=+ /assembly_acc=CAM_ASM_000156
MTCDGGVGSELRNGIPQTDGATSENATTAAISQRGTKGKGRNAAYDRKVKSLSMFSQRFVEAYGNCVGSEIALDEAAWKLGVERRRLYDIVNVFESIGVMVRKAKSTYVWFGKAKLDAVLGVVESTTLEEDCLFLELVFQAICSSPEESCSQKISPSEPCSGMAKEHEDNERIRQAISSLGSSTTDPRRGNSLAILSARFVQLLMRAQDSIVSFAEASEELIGTNPYDEQQAGRMKSKIRRLYDIANILCSLELLRKTHTADGKPAFKWVGPSSNARKACETVPKPQIKSKRKRQLSSSHPLTPTKDVKKTRPSTPSAENYLSTESDTSNVDSLEPGDTMSIQDSPVSDTSMGKDKAMSSKNSPTQAQTSSKRSQYDKQPDKNLPSEPEEWMKHLQRTWSSILTMSTREGGEEARGLGTPQGFGKFQGTLASFMQSQASSGNPHCTFPFPQPPMIPMPMGGCPPGTIFPHQIGASSLPSRGTSYVQGSPVPFFAPGAEGSHDYPGGPAPTNVQGASVPPMLFPFLLPIPVPFPCPSDHHEGQAARKVNETAEPLSASEYNAAVTVASMATNVK